MSHRDFTRGPLFGHVASYGTPLWLGMARHELGNEGGARRGRPHGEVEVARRYHNHGFLDAAKRIFGRHVGHVTAADWTQLVERLLERGRIAEAVEVCRTADLALPRQELLTLGDRHLRRKDVDGAIHYYELAEADEGVGHRGLQSIRRGRGRRPRRGPP